MREPFWSGGSVVLYRAAAADLVHELPTASIDCVITSPPVLWTGPDGIVPVVGRQITAALVAAMRRVFAETRRILKPDGTVWLHIGDLYATHGKPPAGQARRGGTSLLGLPWHVATALAADGWLVRRSIAWTPGPPDHPSRSDSVLGPRHETILLLSKTPNHYLTPPLPDRPTTPRRRPSRVACAGNRSPLTSCRAKAAAERPQPSEAAWEAIHRSRPAAYDTLPIAVACRCIAAGCRPSGKVLDPFAAAAATGIAAQQEGRRCIAAEANPAYLRIAVRRLSAERQGGAR